MGKQSVRETDTCRGTRFQKNTRGLSVTQKWIKIRNWKLDNQKVVKMEELCFGDEFHAFRTV